MSKPTKKMSGAENQLSARNMAHVRRALKYRRPEEIVKDFNTERDREVIAAVWKLLSLNSVVGWRVKEGVYDITAAAPGRKRRPAGTSNAIVISKTTWDGIEKILFNPPTRTSPSHPPDKPWGIWAEPGAQNKNGRAQWLLYAFATEGESNRHISGPVMYGYWKFTARRFDEAPTVETPPVKAPRTDIDSLIEDLERGSKNLRSAVQRETGIFPSMLRAAADALRDLSASTSAKATKRKGGGK